MKCLFLWLFLLPAISYAQIAITGTVTDVNGEVIIGANIVEKGTRNSTVADVNGKFSLTVADDAVLRISFMGYETQEVNVALAKSNHFTIKLLEDVKMLDEVVAVAYGTQKKESVIAALSTISSAGLIQTPASNLGIALAGRLPGLTVLQRSGVPGGESMEFYIRGRSTINGQSPLILVDGVERSFNQLDPHEVETITILKDASATAVYGVRGANGVIMITTRRGQAGKPKIDITMEQSWQAPTRMTPMVSAYDYAILRNQVETQNGRQPIYDNYALERYRLGDQPGLYPVRDFVDEFVKEAAPMQRANVNVSGGSEKMRYFVTVGYLHQEGVFKTEKFSEYDYDPASKADRVNFRSNFDINLTSNLNMFLNVSGFMQKKNDPVIHEDRYGDDNGAYSLLIHSLLVTPANYHNDLTPDGEVLGNSLRGGSAYNVPYGMLNRTGFRNTQNNQVTTTLGVEWKLDFLLPGLSAKAIASYDVYNMNQQIRKRTYALYEAYENPGNPGEALYQHLMGNNSALIDGQAQGFSNLFNIDASLNYARSFGDHEITGLLLFNRYQRVAGIELPYNYVGYVGRATYAYKNRYLAEFNFGYNGSEQFAPGHKMGFFPSFSLGWVLSEEDFMQQAAPWLSFAKLRASYGQVGNDQMGGTRFAFLTLWSGSNESQIGNTELEWEKANKYNIGLETRFFRDFTLEADVFYERRSNILISANGKVPTGVFGTGDTGSAGILPKINSGEVENKGFELVAGYQKSFTRDLRLDLRLNTAFNRNKILNTNEVELPEEYAYRTRETGFRMGQMWGYETAGFFNTAQEINEWYDQTALGPQPQLGDLKYKDQNGDGFITDADKVPIGNPEVPEWTFGAAFYIQYKGFDLSMMWQGVAGRSYRVRGDALYEIYNFNEWHKEAWSQERYDAGLPITYPRLEPGSSVSREDSDFWIIDGSYLRLKNVEIGYTLPKKVTQKIGASSLRFYVNGLNLFTFDHYPVSYQDPEQHAEQLYPLFKTYNIGLNISF